MVYTRNVYRYNNYNNEKTANASGPVTKTRVKMQNVESKNITCSYVLLLLLLLKHCIIITAAAVTDALLCLIRIRDRHRKYKYRFVVRDALRRIMQRRLLTPAEVMKTKINEVVNSGLRHVRIPITRNYRNNSYYNIVISILTRA